MICGIMYKQYGMRYSLKFNLPEVSAVVIVIEHKLFHKINRITLNKH